MHNGIVSFFFPTLQLVQLSEFSEYLMPYDISLDCQLQHGFGEPEPPALVDGNVFVILFHLAVNPE